MRPQQGSHTAGGLRPVAWLGAVPDLGFATELTAWPTSLPGVEIACAGGNMFGEAVPASAALGSAGEARG